MVSFEPRKYIYKTNIKWTGSDKGIISSSGKPEIEIAMPEELGGPTGFWSPDELFVSSVDACAMLTFFWLMEGKNIEVLDYQSSAEGISQISKDGDFRFTTIVLRPKIVVSNPEDEEKIQEIIRKLDNWCCISNSTKAEVTIEPEIEIRNK
jgi:peroxiredoxin-like protein